MNTHLNLSDALGNSISEDNALSLIKSEPESYERFQSFAPNDRKALLEFIQGQRGTIRWFLCQCRNAEAWSFIPR